MTNPTNNPNTPDSSDVSNQSSVPPQMPVPPQSPQTPPPPPPQQEQLQSPPPFQSQAQPHNPYAPPQSDSMAYDNMGQSDGSHFGLLADPRKCEAGRGISWLTEAFNVFKDNWLLWIGMILVYWVILFITGMIPLVNMLVYLFLFHFTAGFMMVCAEQEEGYQPTFGTMFSAFQTHLVDLIILALLYFLVAILAFIPMVIGMIVAFGGALSAGVMSADSPDFSALMGSGSVLIFLMSFLVTMLFFIPILMAVYIAPALIVLHDIKPLEAMKMSFKGCLKNMIPFLLFGLIIMFVFPVVTVFTLGLGLLVLVPVVIISNYAVYRDVWSERMIGE